MKKKKKNFEDDLIKLLTDELTKTIDGGIIDEMVKQQKLDNLEKLRKKL